MVGPVATLAEAAESLAADGAPGTPPALGEHTDAWRASIGG